jgi:anti-anti-sigma regulatory factor
MNIKTDTKEKFTVFTPEISELTDNITEKLLAAIQNCQNSAIPHVILNLQHVTTIDNKSAQNIALQQQQFYENNTSFVICCLSNAINQQLDDLELLEIMNVTPTESEAWDILQMEEIERELLDGLE